MENGIWKKGAHARNEQIVLMFASAKATALSEMAG